MIQVPGVASTHISPGGPHSGSIGYSKLYTGKSKPLHFETSEHIVQVVTSSQVLSPAQEDDQQILPATGSMSSMSSVITGINIASDNDALKEMLKDEIKGPEQPLSPPQPQLGGHGLQSSPSDQGDRDSGRHRMFATWPRNGTASENGASPSSSTLPKDPLAPYANLSSISASNILNEEPSSDALALDAALSSESNTGNHPPLPRHINLNQTEDHSSSEGTVSRQHETATSSAAGGDDSEKTQLIVKGYKRKRRNFTEHPPRKEELEKVQERGCQNRFTPEQIKCARLIPKGTTSKNDVRPAYYLLPCAVHGETRHSRRSQRDLSLKCLDCMSVNTWLWSKRQKCEDEALGSFAQPLKRSGQKRRNSIGKNAKAKRTTVTTTSPSTMTLPNLNDSLGGDGSLGGTNLLSPLSDSLDMPALGSIASAHVARYVEEKLKKKGVEPAETDLGPALSVELGNSPLDDGGFPPHLSSVARGSHVDGAHSHE